MAGWILLSLIAMTANAAKVLTVKLCCQGIDSRLLVFVGRAVSAAVLFPVLLVTGDSFPSDKVF